MKIQALALAVLLAVCSYSAPTYSQGARTNTAMGTYKDSSKTVARSLACQKAKRYAKSGLPSDYDNGVTYGSCHCSVERDEGANLSWEASCEVTATGYCDDDD